MAAAAGPATARRLWALVESVHAVIYFAPQCAQALQEAGLRGFWRGYFPARAAPLGAVGAGPVTAAFFSFHPAMVARAVPACWDTVAPEAMLVVRARGATAALAATSSPSARAGLEAVLPALRAAVAACATAGRMLGAANQNLGPPVVAGLAASGATAEEQALGEVWQHCTTLREHRGDGHMGALLTHGLSGLEALLLATGVSGAPPALRRDVRGWGPEEWEEGVGRLASRGLLEPGGAATAAGRDLHAAVESATDQGAEPAFAALGERARRELEAALTPAAHEIQASGVYPFPNPIGLPRLAEPERAEA